MKQTNGKQMRMLAYAAATLMVAFMATACGNKDGGGGQVAVVPGAVGVSCVGCGNLTGMVASGLGHAISGGQEIAQLSAQMLGDPTILAASQSGGGYSNYNGIIAMGGTMNVRVGSSYPGACVIPAGLYTIGTSRQGTWSGMHGNNLALTAVGPVTLQIEVPVVVFSGGTTVSDWQGATFPFRVQTDFYVTSSSGGGNCSPTDYNGRRYPELTFTQNTY